MEEEIEILKSIYSDDIIRVELDTATPLLEILIYPLDDEENRKTNLRLNMITHFTTNYPNEVPQIELKFVKGITDEDLELIQREIKQIAESNIGEPMLFEIIQHIKDKLSTLGVPKSCNCSICLYDFDNTNKDCVNLECYHYFHTECLIKHMIYMKEDIDKERLEAETNKLKWKQRSISCPVCRNPMRQDEIDHLNQLKLRNNITIEQVVDNESIVISHTVRSMQNKFKLLFEKQKNAGGIIEDKKEEIIILSRPATNDLDNQYEAIANNIKTNL